MRRAYFDNLRIAATLALIIYHAGRVLDFQRFYIKAPIPSTTFEIVTGALDIWMMPVFFFLAGASTSFSLSRKTIGQYLLERAKRLLVPVVSGVVIFLPVIGYFSRRAATGDGDLGFLVYYPEFFRIDRSDLAGFKGAFAPAHLWFLLYLFAFSMICAPLFVRIRNSALLDRLADRLEKTPALLVAFGLFPFLGWFSGLTYPNPFYFIWFFVFGFVLFARTKLEHALRRAAPFAAPVVLVLTPIILWARVARGPEYTPIAEVFPFGSATFHMFVSLNAWCWVLLLLEGARRWFDQASPMAAYLTDAAYPAYLLHLSFIVAAAYYAVSLNMSGFGLFVAIAIAPLIGLGVVYEIVLRRWGLMRFLLGMK